MVYAVKGNFRKIKNKLTSTYKIAGELKLVNDAIRSGKQMNVRILWVTVGKLV